MYNDDAFATMLLTIPLSADRAEYARPLSTAEYRRLLSRVKSSAAGRLGALLRADISGLMMLLGVSEEEGYRLYTLLNRGVQLSYTLENFMAEMAEKSFLAHECRQMYKYFTDGDELLRYIENYSPDDVSWRTLKKVD